MKEAIRIITENITKFGGHVHTRNGYTQVVILLKYGEQNIEGLHKVVLRFAVDKNEIERCEIETLPKTAQVQLQYFDESMCRKVRRNTLHEDLGKLLELALCCASLNRNHRNIHRIDAILEAIDVEFILNF